MNPNEADQKKIHEILDGLTPMIQASVNKALEYGGKLSDLIVFAIADGDRGVVLCSTAGTLRSTLDEDERLALFNAKWHETAHEMLSQTEQQEAHGLVRVVLFTPRAWTRARIGLQNGAMA